MEIDHRLLAGRLAETFRRSPAGGARHLAEGPHAAAPRARERWERASSTEGRGPGPRRVFADGVWSLTVAPGRGCSPLGQSPYGALQRDPGRFRELSEMLRLAEQHPGRRDRYLWSRHRHPRRLRSAMTVPTTLS